jgi:AraC-like DNA-binding protein
MNDALSNLLSTALVNEARWSVVKLSAGTGFGLPADRQLHCVVVADGAGVWIDTSRAVGRPHPSEIPRGSVWLSFGNDRVYISDTPQRGNFEDELAPAAGNEVLSWRRVGKDEISALLIVGTFTVDTLRWAPIKRAVPETIVLRSDNGETPPWAGALSGIKPLQLALTGKGASAFARRLAEMVVTQLIREFETAASVDTEDGEIGKIDRKIVAAVRLINARPSYDWTVTRLATAVGMSRSVFSAEFLNQIGEAPIRYLTHVRMTLACQMLKNPNVPIMEVAHQVGYSSNISLIRTFKRFYGITPAAYREYQSVADSDPMSGFLPAHSAFVFGDDTSLVD